MWNRPTFLVNVLPYALLRPHTAPSMAIPKLLRLEGGIISTAEIFKRGYHWHRLDTQYKESNLEIVANEPDDCLEDFKEFFEAFVQDNERLRFDLKNSEQLLRYKSLCSADSYDYYAHSLIPRRFFEKYQLL